MNLSSGAKLGPYEIVSPLGAGGMGEVYRARDSRLDRTVAIKVLPAHLSNSNELKQRFEREAKAISQLTHPHICTLHDVGHHDGIDYLVMEYIEGETLAQRLAKGAFSLEQVLRIGAEVAAALDKAHRSGVIHRDLKPGNIMLTKTGAKLLDFGLAKSASVLEGDPSGPTLTQPLTSKGTLLGTFQYMAPEQLEGKDADAQTDIFALGAVLYEMATGKRAFEGASRASLIASIMSSQPRSISELQPMTPPALDRLIRKCLAKDPDERWQSAADVADELRWIAEGASQIDAQRVGSRPRHRRERLLWACGALALAVAAVTGSAFLRSRSLTTVEQRVLFSEMGPPDGFSFSYRNGPPAISPDGSMIVFVAQDAQKTNRLFLRKLNEPHCKALDATDGAVGPFWSPDGRSVAFFADRKLKRIEHSGGSPTIVCDASRRASGAWNASGTIIVTESGEDRHPVQRVSASGGTPESVLPMGPAEFWQGYPSFLPDGVHFLYTSRSGAADGNAVMLASLQGGVPRRLLSASSNAVYAPPGFIFYWHADALRARPFNAESLEFTGEPVAIAPNVRQEPNATVAHFTVSSQGTLAYFTGQTSTKKSQLVLYDRKGQRRGVVGEPGNYYSPRFSRDGSRIAMDNSGVENNGDVWVYGVASPASTRLTSDPSDESSPVWGPGDDAIVFITGQFGPGDLLLKRLGTTDPPSMLLKNDFTDDPTDWSPDGKVVVFDRQSKGFPRTDDIWAINVNTKEVVPIVETPFDENDARFSPDGKWLAYYSNESGRFEVYVQSFPTASQRRQVSMSGGLGPRWRADGKEIAYLGLDGTIMIVQFDGENADPSPSPTPLFRVSPRFEENAGDFDMTSDGQTFLVNEAIDDTGTEPMTILFNWPARLRQP